MTVRPDDDAPVGGCKRVGSLSPGMKPGIIGTVQLAVTLAFAPPVAVLGVDFLLKGRPLGVAFVCLAVLMVAVEEYVTGPSDLPAAAAERVAGTVVGSDEEE